MDDDINKGALFDSGPVKLEKLVVFVLLCFLSLYGYCKKLTEI